MTPQRPTRFALLLAGLVALSTGCERVLDLRVALVTKSCDSDATLDPMAGVQLLRFSVYGDGLRAADYEMTASPTDGRVELPQVPAGKGRILVVEGLTSQGSRIVSLGTTGPLDLTVSESAVDVTVFLRRTDAFSIACPADSAVPGNGGAPMNASRASHAVTELEDGRVLITGGVSIDGSSIEYLKSTEIYDPKTGRFAVGPELSLARAHHTATHIPGTSITIIAGGRTGGTPSNNNVLRIADVFDESIPPNGAIVANLQMRVGRRNHAAALLGDNSGRLAIIGGYSDTQNDTATSAIEIFDVRQNRFEEADPLPSGRAEAAAVTIGEVVYVVGGYDGTNALKSTVALRPRVNGSGLTVEPLAALSLAIGRLAPLVAPIGQLLVAAGGASAPDPQGLAFPNALQSTDSLDTALPGMITPSASLENRRLYGAAAPLKNDTILVTGGASSTANLFTVHKTADLLYVNTQGKLEKTPTNLPMRFERERFRLTPLRDGTVLVTGGVGQDRRSRNTAEVFQPTYVPTPDGPWK